MKYYIILLISLIARFPPPPRRKVISPDPSKTEKVELRKVENHWTRPVARGEGIDTDTATEELFKKFQVNEIMKREREQYAIHVHVCIVIH